MNSQFTRKPEILAHWRHRLARPTHHWLACAGNPLTYVLLMVRSYRLMMELLSGYFYARSLYVIVLVLLFDLVFEFKHFRKDLNSRGIKKRGGSPSFQSMKLYRGIMTRPDGDFQNNNPQTGVDNVQQPREILQITYLSPFKVNPRLEDPGCLLSVVQSAKFPKLDQIPPKVGMVWATS
ncbi:hypothetical protein QQS21_012421, partial [Conoideocrella luteorostrata]